MSSDLRTLLERYHYPGNIRELQNILERAMIFCQGRTLTPSCLPAELRETGKQMAVTTAPGPEPVVRVEMKLGQQSFADVEGRSWRKSCGWPTTTRRWRPNTSG